MALLSACGNPKNLADLPSQFVTLEDGSRMHYKCCGSGNVTLLFVHGFGCDMNAWKMQYQDFRNDSIRMIFVDLPGYGLSDKPETDYSLDYMAAALKRVVDTIGARKVVLIGHSLGTPVCREFVFDYPANAVALCDIDGVYCFYQKADHRYLQELDNFVESFRGENLQANIEGFVASLAGPYTPEWIQDYAMGIMPQTPEHVAYSTMKNLVDRNHWTGEKINIPSLIICTRNSGISEDNKMLMDDLYNDFTYVELDNTGHFIMMEDAGIVDNLIERSYERWRTTARDIIR